MSNIYSFFGLPDPNEERTDEGKVDHQESPVDQQESPVEREETNLPVELESPKFIEENFHDLAEKKWRNWSEKHRPRARKAIRYITPDNLHRLPVGGMGRRLVEGDMLVVDLRDLKHMGAQQDACRRELGGLSERLGAPVFALDDTETLMLVPGAGSVVDVATHHLGIEESET